MALSHLSKEKDAVNRVQSYFAIVRIAIDLNLTFQIRTLSEYQFNFFVEKYNSIDWKETDFSDNQSISTQVHLGEFHQNTPSPNIEPNWLSHFEIYPITQTLRPKLEHLCTNKKP